MEDENKIKKSSYSLGSIVQFVGMVGIVISAIGFLAGIIILLGGRWYSDAGILVMIAGIINILPSVTVYVVGDTNTKVSAIKHNFDVVAAKAEDIEKKMGNLDEKTDILLDRTVEVTADDEE